jgi:hypothetical protein
MRRSPAHVETPLPDLPPTENGCLREAPPHIDRVIFHGPCL